MPELTAGELAGICGGEVLGAADPAGRTLVADSREVEPGSIFVAVRGGHGFVAEAIGRGAAFVVVERPEAAPDGSPAVVVEDTVKALADLARWWRGRLDVRAVGITGSTGKTLTKDLVAAAVGTRFRVHAAPRSFNTEVTVPLVVLSAPERTEVLVGELGARRPGEIAELCGIVRPDVGVMTGVGVTHLGIFGSREAIARTKSELLGSLPPTGLAVLPSADDFLDLMAAATDARVRTVGPGGHVRHRALGLDADGRAQGEVDLGEAGVVAVRPPVPGRAILRNAAIALTVAADLGVDPREAARGIETAALSGWRMEVHRRGRRVVVNDAYNANPTSMGAALRTVREMAGTRPAWAVLGEMAELGSAAHAAHVRMGRLAGALGFAGVVVVGDGVEGIAEGYGPETLRAPDAGAAADAVEGAAPDDAVILVKASRVAGLERTADLLAAGRTGSGVVGA